jgi:hypothetical protein
MVQDQDLMKKAGEQVEQEFIRRSSHTNNNRNYNLQQHEKKIETCCLQQQLTAHSSTAHRLVGWNCKNMYT